MKCNRCNDTGELVAVEYMGACQMVPCYYCEAGAEVEALSRQENESLEESTNFDEGVMLEIDEIDEELFFI